MFLFKLYKYHFTLQVNFQANSTIFYGKNNKMMHSNKHKNSHFHPLLKVIINKLQIPLVNEIIFVFELKVTLYNTVVLQITLNDSDKGKKLEFKMWAS